MLKIIPMVCVVVMIATLAQAQQIATMPADVIGFRSVELMLDCVAQAAMNDSEYIQDAASKGYVMLVPKGTTVIITKVDRSGVFSFIVKGIPGVWFSIADLIKK